MTPAPTSGRATSRSIRFVWRWRSRPRRARAPRFPADDRLDRRMAEENRLWGAERIRGELLKLGIRVAKRTVQRFMRGARPATPRWATVVHVSSQPHGLGVRLLADLRHLVPSRLRVLDRRRERPARRSRGVDPRADATVDCAAAAQRDALQDWPADRHPLPRRQVWRRLRPRRRGRRDTCATQRHLRAERHLRNRSGPS